MDENEIQRLINENNSLKEELLKIKSKEQINDYKKFFHLSPDIIIVVNRALKYEYIHIPNVPQAKLDSLIGMDMISSTPEVMQNKMAEALGKVFKSGETITYESEGVAMGTFKYYANYLRPVFDENNVVTHAYILSRDISLQKKSELESKTQQQNLNTLFQSTKHVYTLFDVDQNVIWFNSESDRMTYLIFGHHVSIGENTKNVFPQQVLDAFTILFEKAKAGEIVKYTRKYMFEKDVYMFYEFSLQPILEDGKLLAIAHIGIDVTELALKEENSKKINQELILQNQQLNQYSNIISHNLRGPISTLMGIANVIEMSKEDPVLVEKLMAQVKPITHKIDVILRDLNLLLHHKDQENAVRQLVDLKILVEDIKDFFDTSKFSQVNINIDFREVPTLFTIKGYIHSILFNLVSNAIKYKKITGETFVNIKSFRTPDERVCIEISDNGLGIDMELYGDKIFGFYKRFHNHVEGKGIGLHMTKTQIELLGGSIEVESKVMVGSIFKVYLPIIEVK